MEKEKTKGIIEAILFAAGRPVTEEEFMLSLELPKEEIKNIIQNMQENYKEQNSQGSDMVISNYLNSPCRYGIFFVGK